MRTPAPNVGLEVAKIRDQVSAIKKQAADVRRAPLPHAEVQALLKNRIGDVVERWVPQATYTGLASGGSYGFDPERPLRLADVAFILGTDEVVAGVMARLTKIGPPPGLPAPERALKLEQLEARRVELEREEELQILQQEASGEIVWRRVDADPAVILSVWGEQGSAT